MNHSRSLSTICLLTAALTAGSAFAGPNEPIPKEDFRLILQTTGDWSREYSGSEHGLSDHTIILYEYWAGVLDDRGPEYVDMEAHLDRLRGCIESSVPEGYDGVLIIDYEKYPLSLYCPWYTDIREPRIQAELDRAPGITEEEAERRAAAKYLPHVKNFFLETIRVAKEMRPEAKLGFYGLVSTDRNLPVDDYHRGINDHSSWFYDAVDVITISMYPFWHETEQYWPRVRDLMSDKVAESVRLRDEAELRTGKEKLAMPYMHLRVSNTRSAYHDQWVPHSQASDCLEHAWLGGADGAIYWQAVRAELDPFPTEPEYVEQIEGLLAPVIEELELGAYAPGRGEKGGSGDGMSGGGDGDETDIRRFSDWRVFQVFSKDELRRAREAYLADPEGATARARAEIIKRGGDPERTRNRIRGGIRKVREGSPGIDEADDKFGDDETNE